MAKNLKLLKAAATLFMLLMLPSHSVGQQTTDESLSSDDIQIIKIILDAAAPKHTPRVFTKYLKKENGVWKYEAPGGQPIFSISESTVTNETIRRFSQDDYIKKQLDKLPGDLIASLYARNNSSQTLRQLNLGSPYEIVSDEQIKMRWDKRQDNFMGDGTFSLPGYTPDGSMAIAYFGCSWQQVSSYGSHDAASWGLYLLKRVDGKWEIEDKYIAVT